MNKSWSQYSRLVIGLVLMSACSMPANPKSLLRTDTLCPVNRETAIGGLVAASTFRLIVQPSSTADSATIWTLGAGDTVPIEVPALPAIAGSPRYFLGVSPNGKRLAYYSQEADGKDLWVSSPDGKDQRRVASISIPTGSAYWQNNASLVILGQNNEKLAIPLAVVDAETGSVTPTAPLPNNALQAVGNASFDLYYDGKWRLLNKETHETQDVFQWLLSDKGLYSDSRTFYDSLIVGADDAFLVFDVIVVRPYGVDFALSISLDVALREQDYSTIMKPISLPLGDKPIRVSGWRRDTKTLFVETLDSGSGETQALYELDLQNQILHDYCVNRGLSGGVQLASPDGRFLAWTEYATPNSRVVMLDLETGKLAYLSGFQLLGFSQ